MGSLFVIFLVGTTLGILGWAFFVSWKYRSFKIKVRLWIVDFVLLFIRKLIIPCILVFILYKGGILPILNTIGLSVIFGSCLFICSLSTTKKVTAKELVNKGAVLRDLNRHEEALEAYEQALRLDPKLAPTYNNKGNVLYDLKRYEEALEAYEQALRLNPNNLYTSYNKGNVLYDLKRYEEALEAYEQALRLDPNFAVAYYYKSLILEHLGRSAEAQQVLEKGWRPLGGI